MLKEKLAVEEKVKTLDNQLRSLRASNEKEKKIAREQEERFNKLQERSEKEKKNLEELHRKDKKKSEEKIKMKEAELECLRKELDQLKEK